MTNKVLEHCEIEAATCTVDFENQNYTISTSQCKGPNFRPVLCCSALKKFGCPFAEEISDEKTDCASTMFSHINAMGNYPPALFASLCTEGKLGLNCSDEDLAKSSMDKIWGPTEAYAHGLLLDVAFQVVLMGVFYICIQKNW
ncbi:similar to LORELEI-LIKE-GPI ANCHORED PROTEIN 2 [Actinidia rufa]|uniref:Similar to LORELEI-LIKE-GPI ANCHORED PROTEIN 2 n=1 Tax=Actinidia rufa TaxID=165716 RepID=A0A7J0G4F6_9ERIC|nr:similar to LORELEI-LIKE-GPI ANCHORED PROTEIN 2 [Actinidia rufa]